MLVLISPAKVQNTKSNAPTDKYTLPQFGEEAKELVETLRNYSISELSGLLKSNLKIAEENAERFMRWKHPHSLPSAKQAIFTYNGAVFKSIDAINMNQESLDYTQNHLRILSGLYGILRPLDLIMPYRLDVSTKLENDLGRDLYPFWREKTTREINQISEQVDASFIVNLMSKEYLKVLNKKKIKKPIISVDFLDFQHDTEKYKSIVIYTKQARGEMTRYIMENKITEPEKLKFFDKMGYQYSEKFSKEDNLVFCSIV